MVSDEAKFATNTLMLSFLFVSRRYLLRVLITAPLGHNIHISSTHPFVFGEEHVVMQQLTKVGNCDASTTLIV